MDLYPDERRIRSAPETRSSWIGMKGALAAFGVVIMGLFIYFMDDLNVFLTGDEKEPKKIALQVPAPEQGHFTPMESPEQKPAPILAQSPQEFTEPVIHTINHEVTAEIAGDQIPVAQQKPEVKAEKIAEAVIEPKHEAEPKQAEVLIKEVKTKEKPAAKPEHIAAVKPTVTKTETVQKSNATYALQLLGASDKHKIETFIHERKLEGKAVIAQTKRDGKDWYVVLYGNYANRDEALLDVKKLPKNMNDVQPWPRKFADAGTIIK